MEAVEVGLEDLAEAGLAVGKDRNHIRWRSAQS
jgi:hypothetical protein